MKTIKKLLTSTCSSPQITLSNTVIQGGNFPSGVYPPRPPNSPHLHLPSSYSRGHTSGGGYELIKKAEAKIQRSINKVRELKMAACPDAPAVWSLHPELYTGSVRDGEEAFRRQHVTTYLFRSLISVRFHSGSTIFNASICFDRLGSAWLRPRFGKELERTTTNDQGHHCLQLVNKAAILLASCEKVDKFIRLNQLPLKEHFNISS